jgi:phenylalanyl-tRNA synthetase alpha chain
VTDSGLYSLTECLQVIRAEAGDMAERVKLIDEFTDKLGRSSHAYRIEYRHLDRSLTNREVDELQSRVRASLVAQLQVKLR